MNSGGVVVMKIIAKLNILCFDRFTFLLNFIVKC